MNHLQKYMLAEGCRFVSIMLYFIIFMMSIITEKYWLILFGILFLLMSGIFTIAKIVFAFKIVMKK